MSIEPVDNPKPKPKRTTRAKAPATTNQRRQVPAVRETKPISSRYASRALLSDIAQPMALISDVEPAYRTWDRGAHSLALARQAGALIPAYSVLFEAQQQVAVALRKPLDQSTAEMLLAMLLDAMPKRATGDVETDMEAMLGVVADIGDPLAEAFIDPDPEQEQENCQHMRELMRVKPISPVVLAVAVKKLINKQIFKPQPAELRQACKQAYFDVRGQGFRLEYFMRARIAIDEFLRRNGTDQEKAAARHALDMDDDAEPET